MTKQKSLGQIAYEADAYWAERIPWDVSGVEVRVIYERMAQAVARAVKRRGKGKK